MEQHMQALSYFSVGLLVTLVNNCHTQLLILFPTYCLSEIFVVTEQKLTNIL